MNLKNLPDFYIYKILKLISFQYSSKLFPIANHTFFQHNLIATQIPSSSALCVAHLFSATSYDTGCLFRVNSIHARSLYLNEFVTR